MATPTGDDDVAALKAKVAELELSLTRVTAERDYLAKQLKESVGKPPVWDVTKTEEVEKLQERLTQLKQEQVAANASREAAWKQLKDAVGEISKIVHQSDLTTLSVRDTVSSPTKQDLSEGDSQRDQGLNTDETAKKDE